MDLYIYNTLTRQKELFVPREAGKIKIYSCGPTVYSDPHIGNLRYFWFSGLLGDVCRTLLEYETFHVMNITDVWHLTDDADSGEDKMEKWSRREWLSARDIAKKYENNFKTYLEQLRISFDAHPRATEYIPEQIDLVQSLEQKGYTYEIPGDGIYMDTSKVADYGKLMWPNYKKSIEWLQSGARVDDEGKRNATDFALWKYSRAWENRQMEWDSPRGTWFPWRHIECSAMSRALLGDNFDIHTGWVDHISIHHTDEIAQSECWFCDHTPRVNYWMHSEFLQVNATKISKSLGDDLSLPWLAAKGYSPLDLRFFFFTGKYNNFQDFTWEALEAAKTTRHNIIKKIAAYSGDRIVDFYDVKKEDVNDILYNQLILPILDDLDTPKLLAHIQKALGNSNDEVLKALLFMDKTILKIWLYEWVDALVQAPADVIPNDIQALAQSRRDAKKSGDYALADAIRKQLLTEWWIIEDTKEWFSVNKA